VKRLGTADLHLPVPPGRLGSLSESLRRFSAYGPWSTGLLGTTAPWTRLTRSPAVSSRSLIWPRSFKATASTSEVYEMWRETRDEAFHERLSNANAAASDLQRELGVWSISSPVRTKN
jgi:hypothetical protein